MNKFNPNKNIIVALVVAILVVALVSVTSQRRAQGQSVSAAGSAVNDSVGMVDKLLSLPGNFFHGIINSVDSLLNTYQENQQLKAKLDHYDEAMIQTKNQEEEIAKLKEELNLNQTLTSYEKIVANVISRSPDSWQDILVCDKGSLDGIEVNMAVMSGQGLVGRVIQVNQKTSKIELLTSTNQSTNHFPVRIMENEDNAYGLLSRYDEKNQTFVISQLTGNAEISKGDIVQTSGLGGLSPANLLVGTVISVKNNASGLGREVQVKPATQMYDISVVTIVKRMVEEGE